MSENIVPILILLICSQPNVYRAHSPTNRTTCVRACGRMDYFCTYMRVQTNVPLTFLGKQCRIAKLKFVELIPNLLLSMRGRDKGH